MNEKKAEIESTITKSIASINVLNELLITWPCYHMLKLDKKKDSEWLLSVKNKADMEKINWVIVGAYMGISKVVF